MSACFMITLYIPHASASYVFEYIAVCDFFMVIINGILGDLIKKHKKMPTLNCL